MNLKNDRKTGVFLAQFEFKIKVEESSYISYSKHNKLTLIMLLNTQWLKYFMYFYRIHKHSIKEEDLFQRLISTNLLVKNLYEQ